MVGTYSNPANTRHHTHIDFAKHAAIPPINKPRAMASSAKEAKTLLPGPTPVCGENKAKSTSAVATQNGAKINTLLIFGNDICGCLTPNDTAQFIFSE